MELNVCIGSSCHLKGSYNVLLTFQQLLEEEGLHDKVDLKAQFCMKQCQKGVSVSIEDEVYSVSPDEARDFFREYIVKKL